METSQNRKLSRKGGTIKRLSARFLTRVMGLMSGAGATSRIERGNIDVSFFG